MLHKIKLTNGYGVTNTYKLPLPLNMLNVVLTPKQFNKCYKLIKKYSYKQGRYSTKQGVWFKSLQGNQNLSKWLYVKQMGNKTNYGYMVTKNVINNTYTIN